MSAYKYMTGEGGIRFLGNWSLRITPPADFNDPFELRPPAGRVFTDEYVDTIFQDNAPRMWISELTEQMTHSLGRMLTPQEITDMVTCIITPSDAKMQMRVLKNLRRKIPGFSEVKFVQIQEQVKSQFPTLMRQTKALAKTYLPEFNSIVKDGFTEQLPAMLGVLCLSLNSNQPLMWAHYADSHRGLMFEFDIAHPTFNCKRSVVDEFGWLRPVSYSKVRPEITMPTLGLDNCLKSLL